MLPLLLLTFWLSAHNLDTNPVWSDERFSIRDAGGVFYGPLDVPGIWERVATGNPWHTPGFFIILHYWGKLVGWELPALRMLPLLFGLLTVAWTYRLGRDVLSPRAGLYGAAILSTSMMYLHYQIFVRMYTQITLLTVFTIWVYLRAIDERRTVRWWEWAGLFIGALGLLYTHYFAAIPLIAIGLYHLLIVSGIFTGLRLSSRWFKVMGVFSAAGVLFLPWLNVLLDGIVHANEYEGLHEIAVSFDYALYRTAFLFGNSIVWLLFITLIFTAALTILTRRATDAGIKQLWFFAAVTLIVILSINEVMKIMHEGRLRYMIGLWPLLALIVGYGLAWLVARWRWLALGLLAVWMGTGIYSVGSRAASRDLDGFDYLFPFHEVSDALAGVAQAGDMVVNVLPDGDDLRRDFHYAGITPFYFGSHFTQTWLHSDQSDQITQTLSEIDQPLNLWVAYRPRPVGLDAFTSKLDDYDYCRKLYDAGDLRIEWYARLPVCCLSAEADSLITYPNQIELAGFDLLPIKNESLPVVTTWEIGADSPYYSYSMALHLTDSAGNLVAQADQGLERPAMICRATQIPVNDLSPGEYTINLIVYNWETGSRLSGEDHESGALGEVLPIGTFEVDR
jgi:4-amino-4-deoxy-L-arabinose transferase-like glycosyltransferase